jgi:hypothetical protein
MQFIDTTDNEAVQDIMLSMMGMDTMAYIKAELCDGMTVYAVYAADGTQLAQFDTQDSAYYTARRNNLEPALIH